MTFLLEAICTLDHVWTIRDQTRMPHVRRRKSVIANAKSACVFIENPQGVGAERERFWPRTGSSEIPILVGIDAPG
jgi:hypothetical protein